MIDIFALFWTVMIFCSIYWYGFLLFYVGYKGARDIRALTRTLSERNVSAQKTESGPP